MYGKKSLLFRNLVSMFVWTGVNAISPFSLARAAWAERVSQRGEVEARRIVCSRRVSGVPQSERCYCGDGSAPGSKVGSKSRRQK